MCSLLSVVTKCSDCFDNDVSNVKNVEEGNQSQKAGKYPNENSQLFLSFCNS